MSWLMDEHLQRPRIGVSSCLLGMKVRFDGGHKNNRFVVDTLGTEVDLVPLCPEMGIGLGVPRETLRLVHDPDGGTRLIAPRSGTDYTEEMRAWSQRAAERLRGESLSGYILKKASPSCGMERVKVYSKGSAARNGVGIFAQVLQEELPLLPLEEEGRLNDPGLRDLFLTRVFARHRLRLLFATKWTVGDLVAFHAREKFLLLTFGEQQMRALGRIVAQARDLPRDELEQAYTAGFMAALARPASTGRHINTLQHIAGFFKKKLDQADRNELGECIRAYRRGLLPRSAALTLFRHHIRRQSVDYLAEQTYLRPYPRAFATV